MKIRTILLVLALLAFLSASVGGYLYYSSLKGSAFREAERQGSSHAEEIGRYVASTLAQNQMSVKALAGLEELQKGLLVSDDGNLAKANSELDHFHQALKVSVCYLMDRTGKTIASSNRSAPDSFVGKNYAFRPYFQQAIQGTPAVHMALGVTSRKRGVYYSHPVYGGRENTPLGVVVIKSSVGSMEREFSEDRGGIALLTDPHGVIFVSSREDLLYHVLWKVSSKTISQIAKSRRFGEGPWPWTGLKLTKRNHAVDQSGNEHLIYEAKVDNYPGWKVVYLVSLKTIDKSVIDPLIKTSGSIILILCFLIGSSVFFLYRQASLDISERKRAEEELSLQKTYFQHLFDNSPEASVILDDEDRIVDINKEFEKLFHYSIEEIKGKFINDLIVSEDLRDEARSLTQKTLQGQVVEKQTVRKRKGGSLVDVSLLGYPITFNGKQIGVYAIYKDITERKQAEEERIRLATAVDQAAESVIISDKRGTIQYVNPAFERLSGFTKDDIVRRNFRVLKSDTHDEDFYREMWGIISSGKGWAGQIGNRMKDGSLRQFETTISPIRDDSGAIVNFVSVNRDVTQEVALEAQLLQAQKMEAVGTLAGGIAHDFNNLLQVIQGYSEVLLQGLNEDPTHHEALQKIHRSAKRGAELTRQLLTFSRKVQSERRPLDLNQEVEQVKNLLERTIPKMIEIELHLDKTPAIVSADPIQVEQALMNLAVNAMDAMSDGGKIIIETERATLDEEFCQTHLGARPGEYVLLTISDNGHGMDKEILEHVFEPFYTTKEVGKGTGLGLAMVYGIVKTHEGYILCYSELDSGTTFKIYLPALVQGGHWREAGAGEDRLKGGDETILLVDDEEYIRELGVELLSDVGYEVLTATDGESALQLYRKEQQRIDLIILDLVIPGMGGKKCYEEILTINPQAKILIVSGYSVNGPGKEAMEAGAKGFLGKPFDVSHMLRAVRDILDED
jgi:PAS domain S-box-containing protein